MGILGAFHGTEFQPYAGRAADGSDPFLHAKWIAPLGLATPIVRPMLNNSHSNPRLKVDEKPLGWLIFDGQCNMQFLVGQAGLFQCGPVSGCRIFNLLDWASRTCGLGTTASFHGEGSDAHRIAELCENGREFLGGHRLGSRPDDVAGLKLWSTISARSGGGSYLYFALFELSDTGSGLGSAPGSIPSPAPLVMLCFLSVGFCGLALLRRRFACI